MLGALSQGVPLLECLCFLIARNTCRTPQWMTGEAKEDCEARREESICSAILPPRGVLALVQNVSELYYVGFH